MTKDRDWKAFCDCIRCAGILTGKEMPMAGVSMMFDLLSEYTLEQVQAAVAAHMRGAEGRFFPTPSHIIQQIEGTQGERSEYAWCVFLKAIKEHGFYDSVRFPLPAYHYAIELLGGWQRISEIFTDISEREKSFRRSEFIALFQRGERMAAFTPLQGKTTVPQYLIGYFESENKAAGYLENIPPVIEITTGREIKQADLLALNLGKCLSDGNSGVMQLLPSKGIAKKRNAENQWSANTMKSP